MVVPMRRNCYPFTVNLSLVMKLLLTTHLSHSSELVNDVAIAFNDFFLDI
jgi:hypothetical protein